MPRNVPSLFEHLVGGMGGRRINRRLDSRLFKFFFFILQRRAQVLNFRDANGFSTCRAKNRNEHWTVEGVIL